MRRLLIALLLVAACGDGATGDLPSATDLLPRAAEAMASVESAEFQMTASGAPVLVTGLGFVSATGAYVAPDRASAALQMKVGDLTVELATVSVAERTWITEPLTGAWNELTPGTGFNPAIVFGSDGWVAVLSGGLADAQVTGSRDGAYMVEGTASAERVDFLTAGLVEGQAVRITLLVDAETSRLRQADFTTDDDAGETSWRIVLGPYDGPLTVTPPG
ncbi:MAG: LppX_LprAFG lipoprotein [Acidimicrobiia bacterium]|nr:MAG: LppX_LprAFG lipoprotein [Acidimicrobiia bacterium]